MNTNAIEQTIQLGSRQITYRLHRANRKTVRIVVSPELVVDVYAPRNRSAEAVRIAVEKKARWIVRTLDMFNGCHQLPASKQYVSGEVFAYLGRHYRLKVEEGSRQPARLDNGFIWVQVLDRNNLASVRQSVETWYRKQARQVLADWLEKGYAIAARHGIPKPSLALRSMRRRWGSCSSAGNITLNVHLVQAPVHCIEYVIMHELCHLRHHNHSKAFYSLLRRCMPDWKLRKDQLARVMI